MKIVLLYSLKVVLSVHIFDGGGQFTRGQRQLSEHSNGGLLRKRRFIFFHSFVEIRHSHFFVLIWHGITHMQ